MILMQRRNSTCDWRCIHHPRCRSRIQSWWLCENASDSRGEKSGYDLWISQSMIRRKWISLFVRELLARRTFRVICNLDFYWKNGDGWTNVLQDVSIPFARRFALTRRKRIRMGASDYDTFAPKMISLWRNLNTILTEKNNRMKENKMDRWSQSFGGNRKMEI